MQTSSEYIKYDIKEYYCPANGIFMRKVHINMIVIDNCYSRSLQQLRAPLLLKEYQYNSSISIVTRKWLKNNW